jgi:hypothetical protein
MLPKNANHSSGCWYPHPCSLQLPATGRNVGVPSSALQFFFVDVFAAYLLCALNGSLCMIFNAQQSIKHFFGEKTLFKKEHDEGAYF